MKMLLMFFLLTAAGQVFGEDNSLYVLKHYPFDEKTLKIEITKMWKDGWYPRGISSDGKNDVAVMYMKADFPLYSDWLLKITSTVSPGAIKQETMSDVKDGWMPADVTKAGGKTIYLFLKPKEYIRIWDAGPGSAEIFVLETPENTPVEVKYTPYALFYDGGKPCAFKFTPSGGTELSWKILNFKAGETAMMEEINNMASSGFQPWGIEQNGGAMTVLFVKY